MPKNKFSKAKRKLNKTGTIKSSSGIKIFRKISKLLKRNLMNKDFKTSFNKIGEKPIKPKILVPSYYKCLSTWTIKIYNEFIF